MNSSHLHCDAIEFKANKKTFAKSERALLFSRRSGVILSVCAERAETNSAHSWINSNSPLQQQKSSGVAWKNRPATDVIEQRQASGVIARRARLSPQSANSK